MLLKKESVSEIYNDPNLNIYYNGEIVDGFSEEEIATAIDNGAQMEYYQSTQPTVKGVIEEQITSFITEHWDPNFYLKKLDNGASMAELSLLGDIQFPDLVNGVLFNLSVITEILPKEASEWFKRSTENILNVIRFSVTLEDISKIEVISARLDAMNEELKRRIEEYDRRHKKEPLSIYFAKILIAHEPMNQSGKVLRTYVESVFHPNVFYVESERKWVVGYTMGNVISELVYMLGISHKEAVERFARANGALNDILQYDADREYFRLMLQTGRTPETEKNLANDFAVKITKYLEKETFGKFDKNPLMERFILELKTPTKKEDK